MTVRAIPAAAATAGTRSARVTPERIVRKVLDLTRSQGLAGWTLRGLAAELDATPNTVYHRYADRAAVVTAVVGHVAHELAIATPAQDLPWRGWLRQYAGTLRAVLVEYPGVARELAIWAASTTGPAHPVMRVLTRVLRAASAADPVADARLFLQQVCSAVDLEAERRRRGEQPWVVHGEGLAAYAHVVDSLLDGLAARLPPPEGRNT